MFNTINELKQPCQIIWNFYGGHMQFKAIAVLFYIVARIKQL